MQIGAVSCIMLVYLCSTYAQHAGEFLPSNLKPTCLKVASPIACSEPSPSSTACLRCVYGISCRLDL